MKKNLIFIFLLIAASYLRAQNEVRYSANLLLAYANASTTVAEAGISQSANRTDEIYIKEGNFTIYPNPANDIVNITFQLEKPSNVSVVIKDLIGNSVITTTAQHLQAGEQKITLSIASLRQGVYLVELNANETKLIQKLTKI